MRNNAKRRLSIIVAGCAGLICATVGSVSLVSAETADPTLSMENNGAFYAVEGASIRLYQGTLENVDGNAMRFAFEMSEDQYESIVADGAYKDGWSVSSYVIAENQIDQGLTTAAQIAADTNAVKTVIPADRWSSATSKVEGSSAVVYYACAYVYNLPEEHYGDNADNV